MRRFFASLVFAGLPAVLAFGGGACGTNSLAPKGNACFQAIDGQIGLFWLGADGGAAGTCSDCASCVATLPEAGSDATTDAVADSPTDAVIVDSPPPDTGPKDTGPPDTSVQDTGTDAPPPMDAGAG